MPNREAFPVETSQLCQFRRRIEDAKHEHFNPNNLVCVSEKFNVRSLQLQARYVTYIVNVQLGRLGRWRKVSYIS